MQRFRRIRLKSLIEATSGSRVLFEEDRSLDEYTRETSSDTDGSENGKEEINDALSDKTDEISSEGSITDGEPSLEAVRWPFSYLFAKILKIAATEMNVLTETNYSMKNAKVLAILDVLKDDKYGMEHHIVEDDADEQNRGVTSRNKLEMNKLYKDGEYIKDVLKSLYTEIVDHGTFRIIQKNIAQIMDKRNYFLQLIESEACNVANTNELKKRLQQKHVRHKIAIYDKDVIISDLLGKIHDSNLLSPIRERYVENWQGARIEQNELYMQFNRQDNVEIVDAYKINFEREQRIHLELESYNNMVIYETLEKLGEMSSKYDADLEALDLKVQIKKHAYLDILEKRMALEKQFSERKEEMQKWINNKEEKYKAQEYRNKMNNSAIIVQAWWRGLLVRLQLGPYKKKTKKKADGYRRRKYRN